MTLQPFNFNGSEVRTLVRDGEPWFVATDVCGALEIANTSDALNGLDRDEQAGIDITDTSSNGVTQRRAVLCINEPGLYSLVLRSRKPEAKAFKRWITHEVLPAIRKTGKYEASQSLTLPTTYKDALKALLAEVEENERLQIQNAEMQPKAEFADALACSEGCVSFEVAAKTLKLPFGRNTLIRKLREDGYLYKKGPSNIPYQSYVDSGHFEVTTGLHARSTGAEPHHTTFVTPKGLMLLHKKYGASAALAVAD